MLPEASPGFLHGASASLGRKRLVKVYPNYCSDNSSIRSLGGKFSTWLLRFRAGQPFVSLVSIIFVDSGAARSGTINRPHPLAGHPWPVRNWQKYASSNGLVEEVPHAGEDHRRLKPIGRRNDFGIPN